MSVVWRLERHVKKSLSVNILVLNVLSEAGVEEPVGARDLSKVAALDQEGSRVCSTSENCKSVSV